MPEFSKKMLGFTTISSILLITSIYQYWSYLDNHPSTDNAYLNANRTEINTNISGQVTNVYIKNNQKIKKGQLLFQIDDKAMRVALKKAQAELDIAKQAIMSDKQTVEIAKASIVQAKAQYKLDKKNALRINSLVKNDKASIAEGDKVNTKLSVSRAMLHASKKYYLQAVAKLGGKNSSNAHLKHAKAIVEQAQLNLTYSQVKAPASGKVSQFSLRPGDMVKQGQALFSLIEQDHWWVDANFKETQLKKIKVGQKVTVILDMFPDTKIYGHIESISAGTGAAFSILPAENSAGNWVKTTQRIPVKILLDRTKERLTLGASAYVTVTTNQ